MDSLFNASIFLLGILWMPVTALGFLWDMAINRFQLGRYWYEKFGEWVEDRL